MILTGCSIAGEPMVALDRGLSQLGDSGAMLATAVHFALFGGTVAAPGQGGLATLAVRSSLDGREYLVTRLREQPRDWNVQDVETGCRAATGEELAREWLATHLELAADLDLSDLFEAALTFSIPASLAWLADEPAVREHKFTPLLCLTRFPAAAQQVREALTLAEQRTHSLSTRRERAAGGVDARQGAREEVARLQAEEQELQARLLAVLQAADIAAEHQRQAAELAAILSDTRAQAGAQRLRQAALEAEIPRLQESADRLAQAQASLAQSEGPAAAHAAATEAADRARSGLAGLQQLQLQHGQAAANAALAQATARAAEAELLRARAAKADAKALQEHVTRQDTLERRLAAATEKALRLPLIGQALDAQLTDSKRVEAQAEELERQLDELKHFAAQADRAAGLEAELLGLDDNLHDAIRQQLQGGMVEQAISAAVQRVERLRRMAGAGEASAADTESPRAQGPGSAARLREVILEEIASLDTQIQSSNRQLRDLSTAPVLVGQIQAKRRRLQEELKATHDAALKAAAARVLRRLRTQLAERLKESKASLAELSRAQQECAAGPAEAADLRRELLALGDPRAELRLLERLSAREPELESELRSARRALDEALKSQHKLEARLAEMPALEAALAEAEAGRREHEAGYVARIGQLAIVDALAGAPTELAQAEAELEALRATLAGLDDRAANLAGRAAEEAAAADADTAADVAAVKSRLAAIGESLGAAEAAQAALVAAEQEVTSLQVEEAHLTRATGLLEATSAMLQQVQRDMGGHLRGRISATATHLLGQLLPDRSLVVRWREDDAALVWRQDQPVDVVRLPPVEQLCCVLAFRLALVRSLCNARFTLLTHWGISARRGSIASQLARLTDFSQFLVLPEQ
ncbi:MAG TPA: hypothetical protein VMV93_02180 [Chloroflexota bacterium]|nr:hypothetical protein [Chloroflexota bacterium]